MRSVSRGQVKLRAQLLANVVGDPNVSDAELNELFDLHLASFWDLLMSAGVAGEFALSKIPLTTVGGQIAYPISTFAPDFLSLVNVYAIEAANIRRPIFPFTDKQRGMYREPGAAWPLEIEYIPACPTLTDDAQKVDSIDRWDVYVSALMARDILKKRKEDSGIVADIIASSEARIKTYGGRRARGGPKYIEDVEATGMFFPPTVRINGWRLRGNNLELYELVAIGWP